tara:strand:+ start:122 stop:448 length:327 start_codon:yes stop_codon:yes gene_type:complete
MSKHREPFANSNAYHEERSKEPEQILWISVLTLAMNDAFRSNDWNAAIDAINWIKHDSGDFKRVCVMAGRSPQYIRERILQALLDREAEILGTKQRILEGRNNGQRLQ